MEKNQDFDRAEARFNALVREAKREMASRETHRSDHDGPYVPIRAIVVNSLCFLLPGLMFLILAPLLLDFGIVACYVGICLPTAICMKIISSYTLARWVTEGAMFFLFGMIGLILLFLLGLPMTFMATGFVP